MTRAHIGWGLAALVVALGLASFLALSNQAQRVDRLSARIARLTIPSEVRVTVPAGITPVVDGNLAALGIDPPVALLARAEWASASRAEPSVVVSPSRLAATRATRQRRDAALDAAVAAADAQRECLAPGIDVLRLAAGHDAVSDSFHDLLGATSARLLGSLRECAYDATHEDVRRAADALKRLSMMPAPTEPAIGALRNDLVLWPENARRLEADPWSIVKPGARESLEHYERIIAQLEDLLSGAPLSSVPDADTSLVLERHACAQLRLRMLAATLKIHVGDAISDIVDPRTGRSFVQQRDVLTTSDEHDACDTEVRLMREDSELSMRIDALVRARWADVLECRSSGRVEGALELEIATTEEAASVTLIENETNDPGMGGCLAERLVRWRLPRTRDPTTIRYVVDFDA